jgi:S1-C subfamily serine protease
MSLPRIFPGLLLFSLCSASTGSALTTDEQNTVDIYKRVNASVVNITSIAVTYDFFLNPIPSEASGSGSVIDKKGYILTNNHVVKDAQRLEVTLADGSRWPARLVGADRQTDLAVIQIKVPPERLTVAPIGDSGDLFPGQKVIAIGNPFGLERTLTTEIISSVRKTLKTDRRGGPASAGGNEEVVIGNTILIVGGDIIVGADGESVESSEAFYRILKRKKPGETLEVELYRGGQKKGVRVKLEERPRR